MSSSSYSIPNVVAFICQRFPFISHVFVFLLAYYGPSHAPLLYCFVFLGIHLMMHVANWQTFLGAVAGLRGIRAQVEGKWRNTEDGSDAMEQVKKVGATDADIAMSEKRASNDADEFDLESRAMDRIHHSEVEHVILIPNYKEDVDVLQETLDCLASHPAARSQYRICLAMESREIEASDKARQLMNIYNDSFKAITATMHPPDVAGEAVGKASNVNYAARQIAGASSWSLRSRQIITTLDADILIAADFFERAAMIFAAATKEDRSKMMFLLPIVFDRNADQVPPPVRATDVTWALAGMSTMYPSSMIKIPTSCYAISMDLAMRIGFWDVGHEGIGEDFHMLCKALLSSGGLVSHVIYSPASVTDVVGKDHGVPIRGLFSDMAARYYQAVRHLWGSLDTGYVLRRLFVHDERDYQPLTLPKSGSNSGFVEAAVRPRAPSPTASISDTPGSDTSTVFPGRESGLNTPISESVTPFAIPDSSFEKYTQYSLDADDSLDVNRRGGSKRPRVPILRTLALLCKCYQAHLMLVHFILFLTLPQLDWQKVSTGGLTCSASSSYTSAYSTGATTDEQDQMSPLLAGTLTTLVAMFKEMFVQYNCRADLIAYVILSACAFIRFMSVPFMIGAFLCYHFYRKIAVERYSRPGALEQFGTRPGRIYNPSILSFIDYAFFPLGVAYSIVPAVYAHTMHLFTNELRYTVSFKPKAQKK